MSSKILRYVIALAALFPLLVFSEDTVKNKYLFISNSDRSGQSKIIKYDNAGTITFRKVDGHYEMNVAGETFNCDEYWYLEPTPAKIQFRDSQLHVDKSGRTDSDNEEIHIEIEGGSALYLPVECRSVLPDWVEYKRSEGTALVIEIQENNDGMPREADVDFGYTGSLETSTLHIRQEADLFFFFDTHQHYTGAVLYDDTYYIPAEGGDCQLKFLKGAELKDLKVQMPDNAGFSIKTNVDSENGTLTLSFSKNTGESAHPLISFFFGNTYYCLNFTVLGPNDVMPGTPVVSLNNYELTVDRKAYKTDDGEDRDWWILQDESLMYDRRLETKSVVPEWLSVRFDRNGIIFRLNENESGQLRKADVAIGFEGYSESKTVHVKQYPETFFEEEQPAAGGKYFGRKYYIGPEGADFAFNAHRGVEIKDLTISHSVIENGESRPLGDNEKVALSVNTDTENGLITFAFGKNMGKRTETNAEFSMGSKRYRLNFVSLDNIDDMPETPRVSLDSYELTVDRKAYKTDDGEDRDWWILQDESLMYDRRLETKSVVPEWLSVRFDRNGIIFRLNENESGQLRKADVAIGFEGYSESKTVHVKQYADVFITDEMQEPGHIIFEPGPKNFVQPAGDTFTFHYLKGAPFTYNFNRQFVNDNGEERDLQGDERIPIDVAVDREAGTVTFTLGENKGLRTTIDTEFQIGSHTYGIRFTQMEPGMPSFAEQKAALEELYRATDGDHWKDRTKWMSDQPLALWHGITVMGKYVTNIYLSENNLYGEVPNEALMTLMLVPVHFEIYGNGIYGHISDELQATPQWQRNGMSLLCQNPYFTKLQRFTNYKENLRIPDETVEYLFEEEGTSTLYEILSRHQLNFFTVGDPSEFEANTQLSYPGRFQNVVTSFPYFESRESIKERVAKHPFRDQTVNLFRALYSTVISSWIGTTFILDNNGYVINVSCRDWSVDQSYYDNIVAETARRKLGEPTEHEWLKYPEDTGKEDMTDDGKYKCLHKASTAKGFDIVLMGDGFKAAANAEGGEYEQLMTRAMEYLLATEPLNSLRERINVYMVNVVSQSSIVGDGNTALNYDDAKCREYAAKIPGVDMANVVIVNITNRLLWDENSGGSYCDMNPEGWAVAHIANGGVSPVLNHECIGHGIGRFLDEYIIGGYSENKVSEDSMEEFRAWLDGMHALGMGLNVDYNSDPTKVYWSRMLSDERYKGHVGIYQGAHQYPFDLYRSTENSLMGTENSAPSAVQRMIIYKRIMSLTEGPDWEFDYEEFVKFDSKNLK